LDIYESNLIIRRRFLKMSLWKTWCDVWDIMIVEEWLTRIWPWFTMHQRRASLWIVWFYESTFRGSSGYCYSLLLFIICLKVNWIDFVVNSLTKLDYPILTVLIPLQVLLNFRITYSPLSRRHQWTFKYPWSCIIMHFVPHALHQLIVTVIYICARLRGAGT
jgi:hypothetical protein